MQVTAETGFKVPPTSPEETVAGLARAISALAGDAGLRARMGQAARRRVEEHFAWERKGRQLDEFYAGVLAAQETPPAIPRTRAGRRSAARGEVG